MEVLKLAAAIVFFLAGIAGWLIILIDAFQDEIWKGILGLFCGLYLLYYGVAEFEHEHKWLIVLLFIGGSGIASGIMNL